MQLRGDTIQPPPRLLAPGRRPGQDDDVRGPRHLRHGDVELVQEVGPVGAVGGPGRPGDPMPQSTEWNSWLPRTCVPGYPPPHTKPTHAKKTFCGGMERIPTFAPQESTIESTANPRRGQLRGNLGFLVPVCQD